MPISTFIIRHCFEQIIQNVKHLMTEKKEIFIPENQSIQDIYEMTYRKASIVSVHPQLKTANLILLHIGLKIESNSFCRSGMIDDWIQVDYQITLDYYLTFNEEGYELIFIEARKGIRNNYDEQNSLRADLIPYIQASHYDDEAERFLHDVYPEALNKPMPVDVFEIAKRLGLHTQETSFKECSQILGRTYFDDVLTSDTEVEEVIERQTVLYDSHHYNLGQLHNTILHECFHWYKHRHYFALKRYFTAEEIKKLYKEDASFWIEKQARAVTPRILMPKKIFSQMARSLISELELTVGSSYLNILEQTITKLASFFQVSRLSAKLRMVEIGYPEARGVLDYIDGRYLPAYSFKVNEFKGNQTFTIPLDEVDKLLEENTDFANVMKMGLYVYLESHFVLNLPDYVERDGLGNLRLTREAREHLDECALVFEYQYKQNEPVDIPYHDFILNRSSFGAISFQMVYQNGYEHSTKEKQDAILVKQLAEEDRIYNQLSNDFEASMKVVMKWRKLTPKQIAQELYYDVRTIRRLFKGDASLELFILFCICLNLPPSISGHLLDKSRWKLDMGNVKHRRYQMVLNNFYSHSIEQVKEFLNKVGVEL